VPYAWGGPYVLYPSYDDWGRIMVSLRRMARPDGRLG